MGAYEPESLVNWHERLRGRGFNLPSTSAIEFCFMINTSIRTGITDLNRLVVLMQLTNAKTVLDTKESFKHFADVLKTHVEVKHNRLLRAWELKDQRHQLELRKCYDAQLESLVP